MSLNVGLICVTIMLSTLLLYHLDGPIPSNDISSLWRENGIIIECYVFSGVEVCQGIIKRWTKDTHKVQCLCSCCNGDAIASCVIGGVLTSDTHNTRLFPFLISPCHANSPLYLTPIMTLAFGNLKTVALRTRQLVVSNLRIAMLILVC